MTFTAEELEAADDAATPYLIHQDQLKRSKNWPIRATAAGAINTSVAAIANWMTFLLSEGEFDNERLLSTTLVRQKCKRHVFSRPPRNSSLDILIMASGSAQRSIAESGSLGIQAAGLAGAR